MTDIYDRQTVNSRHLVAFSKPSVPEGKQLYYFDFGRSAWRKVVPLDNLPYNLCSYRFVDDDQDNDGKCVVTCHDSYRLTTDPDNEPSPDALQAQRTWRDAIVKKDAEFEYLNVKNETVQRAKVCWTKADIIPGVVVCGPREFPNMNGFGYIYKESRRFAKTGTHLPLLTEEDLEKERNEEEEADRRREAFQQRVESVKRTYMKRYTLKVPTKPRHVANMYVRSHDGFCDTLPYFQTLRPYPHEITVAWIENKMRERGETDYKWNPNISTHHCIMASILLEDEPYDWCFATHTDHIESYNALQGADCYFDVRVTGGTYCRLHCGDSDDEGNYGRDFDFVKDGDTWTLPDVTIANPLFAATAGSTLRIETDGDTLTYKKGFIQFDISRIFSRVQTGWSVSHLQGRILLNGHMWMPSMSFPESEMVEIPHTQPKPKKDDTTINVMHMGGGSD